MSKNLSFEDEEKKRGQAAAPMVLLSSLVNVNSTNITFLNLSGSDLRNKEDIRVFTNNLKDNGTITSLNLRSAHIKPGGIILLAAMLEVNKTIKAIDLSNIGLKTEGTKYIHRALRVNKSIETIDLGGNDIKSLGAEYIVLGLGYSNCRVTSLGLSNNDIGYEGAREICKIFEEKNFYYQGYGSDLNNAGVAVIYLQSNPLGVKGIMRLLEELSASAKRISPLFLDLRGTGFDKSCREYLLRQIKAKRLITTIRVDESIVEESSESITRYYQALTRALLFKLMQFGSFPLVKELIGIIVDYVSCPFTELGQSESIMGNDDVHLISLLKSIRSFKFREFTNKQDSALLDRFGLGHAAGQENLLKDWEPAISGYRKAVEQKESPLTGQNSPSLVHSSRPSSSSSTTSSIVSNASP